MPIKGAGEALDMDRPCGSLWLPAWAGPMLCLLHAGLDEGPADSRGGHRFVQLGERMSPAARPSGGNKGEVGRGGCIIPSVTQTH